jgi:hypothetical protein
MPYHAMLGYMPSWSLTIPLPCGTSLPTIPENQVFGSIGWVLPVCSASFSLNSNIGFDGHKTSRFTVAQVLAYTASSTSRCPTPPHWPKVKKPLLSKILAGNHFDDDNRNFAISSCFVHSMIPFACIILFLEFLLNTTPNTFMLP